MKAIAIFEMPKSCGECPCFGGEYEDCQYSDEFSPMNPYIERPKWCPLKPMPEKKIAIINDDYIKGRCQGWNDCIDAILREANDSST